MESQEIINEIEREEKRKEELLSLFYPLEWLKKKTELNLSLIVGK